MNIVNTDYSIFSDMYIQYYPIPSLAYYHDSHFTTCSVLAINVNVGAETNPFPVG